MMLVPNGIIDLELNIYLSFKFYKMTNSYFGHDSNRDGNCINDLIGIALISLKFKS